MSNRAGRLIIVSAPSGAGKSTLVKMALARDAGLVYSISYTTREPRCGEQNGREYCFVTVEDFLARRARNEFLECAEVHQQWYGTSRLFIETELRNGRDVLLDIDVQGATQVCAQLPDTVSVFILPPSFQVLKERLQARQTDNSATVERRLQNARREVGECQKFQYVIINDDREAAADALVAIILAARQQQKFQAAATQKILETFKGE